MASKQPASPLDTANPEESSKEFEVSGEFKSEKKILFWCPECGQKYRLPKDTAGQTGICFKCQAYLFIPSKSQKNPPQTKMIVFACAHCGSKQRKSRKLIGTEAKCSECDEKNIVPKRSKTSSLSKNGDTLEERILFWCDHCGQKYRLAKHLSGKAGNCDRCHNDFIIPEKSQTKPALKETTIFPCQHCGQKQWESIDQTGKEIECKKCHGENIVPGKSKVSPFLKPETENKERIFFWCCHCGQKYRLPRSFAGKRANCDKCQNDFIVPMKSQVKPTRKEIVIFPCEHCGKKIKKTKDIAGTEVKCSECGGGNIVPEKSKKSLLDILSSKKSFAPVIAIEATRMNLKLPQQLKSQFRKTSPATPAVPTDPTALDKIAFDKIKLQPKNTAQTTKQDKDAPIKIYPETEDEIIFWCAYCKQKYRLPHNLAGKRSSCENCQNELLIPAASQTKPELKDAIVFTCEHCSKKLWKAKELAGTEIICHECDKKSIVPGKSKKTFLEKVTPIKLHDSFIKQEDTVTNMIVVGKPPVDPKTKKKFNSKVIYNTDPIEDVPKVEQSSTSLNREAYIGPQIIITENPPTIQKIKNFFQRKAEKYFIFALLLLFLEYLMNLYGEKRRPSKYFIYFSTFCASAIILLSTWNYVTYVPPSKTSKCRYNVTCTNSKCNLNEIRKFEKVSKGTCSKCSSHVGLAYRCKACNKSFVYDEIESRRQQKAKITREANRKAKWTGEKVKIPRGLFKNRIIKKCPYCRSEDVYYVTVKEVDKEAKEAALEKELKRIEKKKAKKDKKKARKKKRTRKKKK